MRFRVRQALTIAAPSKMNIDKNTLMFEIVAFQEWLLGDCHCAALLYRQLKRKRLGTTTRKNKACTTIARCRITASEC
eukprot:2204585-Amphidinium_carterae.1